MANSTRATAPKAFRTQGDFRRWLEAHHETVTELSLRCFKTHASEMGVTYREALDEALCFGWIDGVRHSFDDDSFVVRFTPRKPKSYWSAVNLKRARELEAEGRMRPPGLAALRARSAEPRGRYSFESRPVALAPACAALFRANARAWRFYEAQPPWYRRTSAFWVMSAKKEETRGRRLAELIACSAKGTTLHALARAPRKSARREAAARRPRA
jgi:uncharacterized protein YdeI (YjbR/CyaY-like superfamily)